MSKERRGSLLKYAAVLAFMAACGALLVAGVYIATAERISRNEAQVKSDALRRIFPDADMLDAQTYADDSDGDRTVVIARGGGKIVGYATVGRALGYGGQMRVLVGVGPDVGAPVIEAISVLGHSETPGLGAKIEEKATDETLWSWIGSRLSGEGGGGGENDALPAFQKRFSKRPEAEVKAFQENPKTPGQEIHAITAATISSRAVATAVLDAVEHIRLTIGGEPGVAQKVD